MHRTSHANGVVTYHFAQLAGMPVTAHVATRHGGVSPAPWSTLNFSIVRGDEPARVAENHMRLAAALGYTRANLVTCTQVHGTGIAKVDGSDAGTKQTGCDGLMTDTLGLPLGLVFGDCVPVLLYDRVRNVLGVVHAGWRGTVNGAAAALLWAMQAGYSTQPGNVGIHVIFLQEALNHPLAPQVCVHVVGLFCHSKARHQRLWPHTKSHPHAGGKHLAHRRRVHHVHGLTYLALL